MKFLMGFVLIVAAFFIPTETLSAEIVTETVTYTKGDSAQFEGHFIYDDSSSEKRPGVMIVHQWMGITDYELGRAEQLAEQGYLVFVADIYGKGVRPKTMKAAAAESGKYKSNRSLLRSNASLGYSQLTGHELYDDTSSFAIGYCFGGTVVLEMARAGLDLTGVVSFHGGLDTPTPNDAKNIKADVLVLHGADDPYVPWKDVVAFHDEMTAYDVNYQMNVYANSVHAFSQKMAGNDPSKGAAYNALADARSFRDMLTFFDEHLSGH